MALNVFCMTVAKQPLSRTHFVHVGKSGFFKRSRRKYSFLNLYMIVEKMLFLTIAKSVYPALDCLLDHRFASFGQRQLHAKKYHFLR